MKLASITTLEQATTYLLGYAPHRLREEHYTLDRMHALMTALGNPQNDLRVIHVAGTSGKTSTAYFVRSLLEAAGHTTGLIVSPHIVAINERVQLHGRPLPEAAFLTYLKQYVPIVERCGLKPSYFELLMGFAYWVCAREQVDYAVIETGFGGLLDASNVVSRSDKLCLLTSIGLDHTEILGDTLDKIAYQKAGIIKPGNHVFTYRQPAHVMAVFESACQAAGAPMHIVESEQYDLPKGLPRYHQTNWALASAAADYIRARDGGSAPASARDAAAWVPPGRYERYRYGDKTIILDGAHNPQKLAAFFDAYTRDGYDVPAVLLALSDAPADKIRDSVRIVARHARRLIVTSFCIGQDQKFRLSHDSHAIARYAQSSSAPCEIIDEYTQAFDELLGSDANTLVVTGSLYLVSLIRPIVIKRCKKYKNY